MRSAHLGTSVALSLLLSALPGARAEGPPGRPSMPIAQAQPASQEDTPELALGRVRTHIESLLRAPQPALYARHLRSVLALSEEEVLRLRFAGARRDEQAKELLGYLRTIEAGLSDDGDRSETYLMEGRRALTLARLSRSDDTLQYCTVGLPPRWDPNKAYPLHISLHGGGPRMPLAYVNFTFLPHGADRGQPGPEVIVVGPWMRGNRPWREGGESEADIWEAVADVKSFAKLDPDRWYVSGHSMGADDTWALVTRTPDLWAAAGMMSGATYGAPVDLGLTPNISHVPFYIWIGDQDAVPGRIQSSGEARDALAAMGNPPKFVLEPGVGHMYRPQDAVAMQDWLVQHVRRRPDHFSFVVDTARHRGVWGITVPRKYRFSQSVAEPRAALECWIEGSTVRLQAQGAEQLEVDLGPEGLRMSGAVTLLVNGKQRFSGAVPGKPLTLPLSE